MPLLTQLKFPANAMLMNEIMLLVVTFDLVPTDSMNLGLYGELPEEEAYSVQFEQSGYESLLLIENLGMGKYIIYINLVLAILFLPCFAFNNCCSRGVTSYFYLNGLIKLFIEAYQELVLLAALNYMTADWNSPFPAIQYSNKLSEAIIVLVIFLPIFFLVFYSCMHKRWDNEAFQGRYGSYLDGTNHAAKKRNQWKVILHLTIFFVRRAAFAVSVLWAEDYIWIQLPIQLVLGSSVLFILVSSNLILESSFLTKIEIFNELCGLLLIYMLICFTELVDSAETRHQIGYAYIFVSSSNIFVHLVIMMVNSFLTIKLKIKQKCCKKKTLIL